MPALGPAPFARRFRALTAAERRLFLAELWAARGYDTSVRDGVVVAERGDERLRIDVIGFWPREVTDVDVLVGTRDVPPVRWLADDRADRFLSPEDLHEFFLYGLDRDVADAIAREHLGTSLAIAPSATSDRSLRTPAAAAVAALAVLAIVALSGVGFPPGGDAEFDERGVDVAEADRETSTPTPEPETADFPPGLDDDGVANASALVDAHWSRIDGTSRALSIAYSGPANTTVFPHTIRHESEGRFGRDDRYHVTIVDHVVRDDEVVRTEFESFADGSRVVNRYHDGNETRFTRSPLSERTVWTSMEGFAVERFAELVRANETSVERVRQSGVTLFRIDAVGAPDEFRDDATSYAATAFVTPDGRLVRLTVAYRPALDAEPVRLTISYGEFGDVGIPEPPEWYDEAVEETDRRDRIAAESERDGPGVP